MGKRIKLGPTDMDTPWLTVVGVVGVARNQGLTEPSYPEVLVPYLQPSPYLPSPRDLVVRTASDPVSLIPALRREVWAVDKDQPVSNVQTLEQALSDSLSPQRFNMLF
jgi:putative ABC transport system permease protein